MQSSLREYQEQQADLQAGEASAMELLARQMGRAGAALRDEVQEKALPGRQRL